MTYHQVHQLYREGFSISFISSHLSLNWMRERNFRLHFCRKADPQSKGKVENVGKRTGSTMLFIGSRVNSFVV